MSAAVKPPGAYRPPVDRWGSFPTLFRSVEGPVMVVADARVLALHPPVARALSGLSVVRLRAGEGAKRLATVERLGQAAALLPRSGLMLAVGGGTIGDVATVAAHLVKRGVRLIHVPTTYLAAVDSSVGGKGAVNVAGVKNALGCFHAPEEGWLCPELFTTLSEAQRREGFYEAWKMAVTLSRPTFERWVEAPPGERELIEVSRALKTEVCGRDPYEQRGLRVALNFGHTLGHVVESVTGYRVRHGEAVGLGMVCALDVGVAMRVTPVEVARRVEGCLPFARTARARLGRALSGTPWSAAWRLLRSDKKGATTTDVTFVLLEKPGSWKAVPVPAKTLEPLYRQWQT